MANGDFSKHVVETISKRAANFCSNPDCRVLTCGPAESPDRSLTIGEAAHIFGSRSGSARFKETLTTAERSDITNAIWLCRNCHKIVDSDPLQFPADVLFELRRQHEESIATQLGKSVEVIRRNLLMKQVVEFESCSYLAQQIVIDKPDYWEYKLTIELLRTRMEPIVKRWQSLERGLYVKSTTFVPLDDVISWLQLRNKESLKLAAAFSGLVNTELSQAWGAPGTPGSAPEILRVCDLLVECADRVLQWEESVRFSILPTAFEEVHKLHIGIVGSFLDQLVRIPRELAAIFDANKTTGEHRISLVISMPDGWSSQLEKALYEASSKAGLI